MNFDVNKALLDRCLMSTVSRASKAPQNMPKVMDGTNRRTAYR